MSPVRKNFFITPAEDRALARLARRNRVPQSEIVRRALAAWLAAREPQGSEDPFAAVIGMFSGPEESDHNDVYQAGLRPNLASDESP